MQSESISEDFSKEILRACYALDAQFAAIEMRCLSACEGQELSELKTAFTSLVTVLGARIMVPIYQAHPHLGRIMEPGEWMAQDTSRRKFGFRD
jgi:hypothetical protein